MPPKHKRRTPHDPTDDEHNLYGYKRHFSEKIAEELGILNISNNNVNTTYRLESYNPYLNYHREIENPNFPWTFNELNNAGNGFQFQHLGVNGTKSDQLMLGQDLSWDKPSKNDVNMNTTKTVKDKETEQDFVLTSKIDFSKSSPLRRPTNFIPIEPSMDSKALVLYRSPQSVILESIFRKSVEQREESTDEEEEDEEDEAENGQMLNFVEMERSDVLSGDETYMNID